jgi:hypothetical protein
MLASSYFEQSLIEEKCSFTSARSLSSSLFEILLPYIVLFPLGSDINSSAETVEKVQITLLGDFHI